jgi:glycosyltransferase involved in cell wall biosynthesis
MLRTLPLVVRRPSRARFRHIGQALVLVRRLERLPGVHLHAHFAHPPAAVAYWAHLIAGVPFSFTAHARDLYMTPRAQLARRCRAAAFVVTCTAANARYLKEVVGTDSAKVLVCRHGVDLTRFGAVEHRPAPGQVLSVGRLVPKKGFDTLIRACGLLQQRGVAFQCRIIGSGPLTEELARLIDRLDLGARVELTRARPQPELVHEYAGAEVFAMACTISPDGDRDGIPNVILEAMAVGVPVVATAISGIPEVVRDGETGRLIASGDPIAMADALEWLLGHPEDRARLGATARATVAREVELSTSVRPLMTRFVDQQAVTSGREPR